MQLGEWVRNEGNILNYMPWFSHLFTSIFQKVLLSLTSKPISNHFCYLTTSNFLKTKSIELFLDNY